MASDKPDVAEPKIKRLAQAAHAHKIVPHVPRIYRFTATALGASMWFFLMYRAKQDGD
ncbi:hypothetical protein GGS23DRAFT_597175 [Durotheca rogersii]|uniref:uncharacterized protein n=1 Tax=Durotheca rogersii TaxID=419775 RepID=UPI002220FFFB|nr:uncharacterized protein GGS23DRAFT_597175 [Durotheca rogersii]KAI5862862.1 hypothetical protein GGS23DRAFT_597175 [Durotheca rogersii]